VQGCSGGRSALAATRPCRQWMGGEAEVSRSAAAWTLGAWSTATPGRQGRGARGAGTPGCGVAGAVGCGGTGAGAGSEASKKEKVQGRGRARCGGANAGAGLDARKKEKRGRKSARGDVYGAQAKSCKCKVSEVQGCQLDWSKALSDET